LPLARPAFADWTAPSTLARREHVPPGTGLVLNEWVLPLRSRLALTATGGTPFASHALVVVKAAEISCAVALTATRDAARANRRRGLLGQFAGLVKPAVVERTERPMRNDTVAALNLTGPLGRDPAVVRAEGPQATDTAVRERLAALPARGLPGVACGHACHLSAGRACGHGGTRRQPEPVRSRHRSSRGRRCSGDRADP
jgi:hypothetical protein